MYDVGNVDIKLGIKCTTVLSGYKRYLATDCTDVLPHYMDFNLHEYLEWSKKFIWSLGYKNSKGTLACVVQKMELGACHLFKKPTEYDSQPCVLFPMHPGEMLCQPHAANTLQELSGTFSEDLLSFGHRSLILLLNKSFKEKKKRKENRSRCSEWKDE